MNKIPKKSAKKTKTAKKKSKTSRRVVSKPSSRTASKYVSWEKSLRTNIKLKPEKIVKVKRARKSTTKKKGKTVKKKLNSRKAKSTNLKPKKVIKKKKTKKKKKTNNMSVVSDLNSRLSSSIQQKIDALEINTAPPKQVVLESEGAFYFVYNKKSPLATYNFQTMSDAYKPKQNPFRTQPVKLASNTGQLLEKNIFAGELSAKLTKGKNI